MKRKSVFKYAANLYNTLLTIYFNDHNSIIEKKEEIDKKYDPSNLFLKGYKYDLLYKKYEEKSKLKLKSEV